MSLVTFGDKEKKLMMEALSLDQSQWAVLCKEWVWIQGFIEVEYLPKRRVEDLCLTYLPPTCSKVEESTGGIMLKERSNELDKLVFGEVK